MRTFDNLYVSKIHYLRGDSKFPAYGTSRLHHIFDENDKTIIALMLIVSKNPSQHEIENGRVVPLPKIFDHLPKRLKDGMLSWLLLPGENEPSSLVIHVDVTQENIDSLAAMRLGAMVVEKTLKRPFASFISGEFNKTRDKILGAREQAKGSKLAQSEPVSDYLV